MSDIPQSVISIYITKPDGNPAVNVLVRFELSKLVNFSGTIIPTIVEATTDIHGRGSITLFPTEAVPATQKPLWYRVTVIPSGWFAVSMQTFRVTVPNLPNNDLHDLPFYIDSEDGSTTPSQEHTGGGTAHDLSALELRINRVSTAVTTQANKLNTAVSGISKDSTNQLVVSKFDGSSTTLPLPTVNPAVVAKLKEDALNAKSAADDAAADVKELEKTVDQCVKEVSLRGPSTLVISHVSAPETTVTLPAQTGAGASSQDIAKLKADDAALSQRLDDADKKAADLVQKINKSLISASLNAANQLILTAASGDIITISLPGSQAERNDILKQIADLTSTAAQHNRDIGLAVKTIEKRGNDLIITRSNGAISTVRLPEIPSNLVTATALAPIQTDLEALKSGFARTSNDLTQVKVTQKTLEGDTKSAKTLLATLQQRTESIEAQEQSLTAHLTDASGKFLEFRTDISKLQEDGKTLKSANQELKQSTAAIDTRVKSLESEVPSYVQNIVKTDDNQFAFTKGDGTKKYIRITAPSSGGAVAPVNSDIRDLQTETSELRTDLSAVQVEQGKIKTSASSLNSKLGILEAKVNDNTSNIVSVQEKDSDQDGNIDRLGKRLIAAETTTSSLVAKASSVETSVADHENRITSVENDVAAVQVSLGDAETDLSSLKQTLPTLSTDVSALKTADKTQGRDLTKLKKEVEDLTTAGGVAAQSFTEATAQLVKLTTMAKANKAVIDDIGPVDDLKQKITDAQAKADSIEVSLKAFEAKVVNPIKDLNAASATQLTVVYSDDTTKAVNLNNPIIAQHSSWLGQIQTDLDQLTRDIAALSATAPSSGGGTVPEDVASDIAILKSSVQGIKDKATRFGNLLDTCLVGISRSGDNLAITTVAGTQSSIALPAPDVDKAYVDSATAKLDRDLRRLSGEYNDAVRSVGISDDNTVLTFTHFNDTRTIVDLSSLKQTIDLKPLTDSITALDTKAKAQGVDLTGIKSRLGVFEHKLDSFDDSYVFEGSALPSADSLPMNKNAYYFYLQPAKDITLTLPNLPITGFRVGTLFHIANSGSHKIVVSGDGLTSAIDLNPDDWILFAIDKANTTFIKLAGGSLEQHSLPPLPSGVGLPDNGAIPADSDILTLKAGWWSSGSSGSIFTNAPTGLVEPWNMLRVDFTKGTSRSDGMILALGSDSSGTPSLTVNYRLSGSPSWTGWHSALNTLVMNAKVANLNASVSQLQSAQTQILDTLSEVQTKLGNIYAPGKAAFDSAVNSLINSSLITFESKLKADGWGPLPPVATGSQLDLVQVDAAGLNPSAVISASEINVQKPLLVTQDAATSKVTLSMPHGATKAVSAYAPAYLAYTYEETEYFFSSPSTSTIEATFAKIFPLQIVVSDPGQGIIIDRVNKRFGIQESDLKDPNLSNGRDFLVAVNLNFAFLSNAYRTVTLELVESPLAGGAAGNVLTDVNGQPMRISKPCGSLNSMNLSLLGFVNVKGLKYFTIQVRGLFPPITSDPNRTSGSRYTYIYLVKFTDRLKNPSGILIQETTDDKQTSGALLQYQIDRGEDITWAHEYVGPDYLKATLIHSEYPEYKDMSQSPAINKLYFVKPLLLFPQTNTYIAEYNTAITTTRHTTGGVEGDITIKTDREVYKSDFFFGFAFLMNSETGRDLGHKVSIDITLGRLHKAFNIIGIYSTSISALPDDYRFLRIPARDTNSDLPNLTSGWIEIDTHFLPENQVGDSSGKYAFNIPKNATAVAFFLYPNTVSDGLDVTIKKFNLGADPAINSFDISTSSFSEWTAANRANVDYMSLAQDNEGLVALRYTLSGSGSTSSPDYLPLPVGRSRAGIKTNFYTLDTDRNPVPGSAAGAGEGALHFTETGYVTITTTVRVTIEKPKRLVTFTNDITFQWYSFDRGRETILNDSKFNVTDGRGRQLRDIVNSMTDSSMTLTVSHTFKRRIYRDDKLYLKGRGAIGLDVYLISRSSAAPLIENDIIFEPSGYSVVAHTPRP